MRELLHHVALALAVLALGQAALRIASTAAPRGLERLIATVVLAVAACRQPRRSRSGWSASAAARVALVAAAAGHLGACAPGAARARRPGCSSELAGWWARARRGSSGSRPPSSRAAPALDGLAAAQLLDRVRQRRSTTTRWSRAGSRTAARARASALSYDIPYGNYPLTDEVALTWAAAISRSWVPLVLWNPALLVRRSAPRAGRRCATSSVPRGRPAWRRRWSSPRRWWCAS